MEAAVEAAPRLLLLLLQRTAATPSYRAPQVKGAGGSHTALAVGRPAGQEAIVPLCVRGVGEAGPPLTRQLVQLSTGVQGPPPALHSWHSCHVAEHAQWLTQVGPKVLGSIAPDADGFVLDNQWQWFAGNRKVKGQMWGKRYCIDDTKVWVNFLELFST